MKNDENKISTERRNLLISVSVDILGIVIERGFISINSYFDDNKLIEKDSVYEYFKNGLQFIIEGAYPNKLSLLLEIEKAQWIKDANKNIEDLQLITIIQYIIPCIQTLDIVSFRDICHHFTERDKYSEIHYRIHNIEQYLQKQK
ncbi:MAG: hypothetical protein VB130_15810 [Clostridium sp.]|nr:hypothetical protein [Clostridium sp.]